jgi:hypothetical protein
MTEFVLDIETYPQSNKHCVHGCSSYTKYFFQIDVNGNVNISEKVSCKNDGSGEKKNILSINDNIPVPKHFINIIRALILQVTFQQIDTINHNIGGLGFYGSVEDNIINVSAIKSNRGVYDQVYKKYWEMAIDVIKRMKQEIKELVDNPKDNLDIKVCLDTYITKIKQQQNIIVGLELNNIKLEIENKRLLQELNNIKQLGEYNKNKKIEELEKNLKKVRFKSSTV